MCFCLLFVVPLLFPLFRLPFPEGKSDTFSSCPFHHGYMCLLFETIQEEKIAGSLYYHWLYESETGNMLLDKASNKY